MEINVLQTGAKADGKTLATAAIQSAIDSCADAGGGVVTIPAGNYLSGKVFLRSHVTVVLEAGARIIASPNQEDYPVSPGPKDSVHPYDPACPTGILSNRWCVFYGCELEDVALKGPGMIDGNYKNILVPRTPPDWPSWSVHENDLELYTADKEKGGFRPTLVMIEASNEVHIEDLYLCNAPCYTVSICLCNHVQFKGVRIENALGSDNADGVHFSSCSDVLVANCDLTCGDDSIAIDADEGKPSERYVITNCIITSRNNCFRIFHSLHNAESYRRLPYSYVRDISISNCVVREADSVVCMNADKGEISQVIVSGITGRMNRWGTAFLITSHNNSRVDRIMFKDWCITSRGVGYMYAEPESTINNIDLSNLDIVVNPKTQLFGCGCSALKKVEDDCPIKDVPCYWWSHHLPFYLHILNVNGLNLDNIKIDWGSDDGIADLEDMDSPRGKAHIEWLETECHYPKFFKPTRDWPAIRIEDCTDISKSRLKLKAHGNCPDKLVIYKGGQKISAE